VVERREKEGGFGGEEEEGEGLYSSTFSCGVKKALSVV